LIQRQGSYGILKYGKFWSFSSLEKSGNNYFGPLVSKNKIILQRKISFKVVFDLVCPSENFKSGKSLEIYIQNCIGTLLRTQWAIDMCNLKLYFAALPASFSLLCHKHSQCLVPQMLHF